MSNGDFQVLQNEKLPLLLRDNIIPSSQDASRKAFIHNYRALMDFFHNRTLSIERRNAKQILNALKIPQSDTDSNVSKMMILCKGLSASDDYWITNHPEKEHWADNNLRDNPLHEVLAQISLYGDAPVTITGEVRTPELTGQGAYAKAWFRENHQLYLYKASTDHGRESEVEAEVSRILDYTNAPHVHYDFEVRNGKRCSKCLNLCNEDVSMVSAFEVMKWCNRTGQDFDRFVREKAPENFYKTVIVDYLISNNDRHTGNWGFYMDNKTGEITGLHPIYDNNNAFAQQDMSRVDGGESLMMVGKSKKDAAKYAVKHCHFHIDRIPSKVFLSKAHEKSFKKRAELLGLYKRSFIEKAKMMMFFLA